MKKKLAIAVVVASLAVAGLSQAYAGWGNRGGGYGGGFYGNCPQFQGGQYSQLDPAAQEKMDQFLTQTQQLRKDLAMKQAERQAMLRSTNPDPAAMSAVTGELFDLRAALQQKAEEAGVSDYIGPMSGRGPGFGMGGPGRGRGMGPMMMNPGQGPGANRF